MKTNKERLAFIQSLPKGGEPFEVINCGVTMTVDNILSIRSRSGIAVGGQGFGYEWDGEKLVEFPHRGGVIIERDVSIGANTCIDRATIKGEYTTIGEGTKIDNLVHIAHNVKIGKHCLIVAGAVIGGSVTIGDRGYIGIGAMIKNKVKIGNDVTVGMGAVVLKDIPDGETWIGNPARKLEK